MAILARPVSLATGALAAARAPQAPVPPDVQREIATTRSDSRGASAFSAQVSPGLQSGSPASAPLAQAPAVVLQSPGPVNPTLPATKSTPMGARGNGIKSLSVFFSASAMIFLTGCEGVTDVDLQGYALGTAIMGLPVLALSVREWRKSHAVKQLAALELAAQQKVVDEAILVLETEALQAEYFSENPHKALEVVTALKNQAEEFQLKQKQDVEEMKGLKKTAEAVLNEMRQTRIADGASSYYDLNPDVVRMLTDFMATCDAVLEDADRSALGDLDELLEKTIPSLLEDIQKLVKAREEELQQLRTAEDKTRALEKKIQRLLGQQVKLSHGMAERARSAVNLVQGVRALQGRVDLARAWSELNIAEKLRSLLPPGTTLDWDLLNQLQIRQGEALKAEAADPQAKALRAAQPAGASGAQARQMSAQGGGS